jgi:hypothetical protein
MKALIALSVAVAFATLAAAADRSARNSSDKAAAPDQAKFESLDRDRDGALNKREAKSDASITAQFDSMDVNLDGYITRAEYQAYTQRTREQRSPGA